METVAAVVLAAGRSARMGGANKLLLDLGGAPLIRRTAATLMEAGIGRIVVVVGHDGCGIRGALTGLAVDFADNARYAEGLASSLRTGIAAVGDCGGVLICLGDMPWVRSGTIRALVAAHAKDRIVVPVGERGRRGNPVLWDRSFFSELTALHGDMGARNLIAEKSGHVFALETDDPGIFRDIDTPADVSEGAEVNWPGSARGR